MTKTDKQEPQQLKINSRFGEIEVDTSKSIFFPKGLYGMPDNLTFGLVKFPGDKFPNFSVLQCLNDYSLSFVVLPASFKNSFVDEADMREAAEHYDIKEEEFAALFIVSVQRSPEKTFLTINAKAPVIINTVEQAGVQHVFSNARYSVKHEVD